MTTNVHISSLVVQARPDRLAEVRDAIAVRGGDIPADDPNGKLVVVLETDSETKITDFLNEIAVMPGVLSANLVFHHHDEDDTAPVSHAPAVSLGGNT